MTQISKYPISGVVYERIFDIFLETFVKLNSKKAALNFINEFLTPTEKIMLAKRLAIGLLLAKNFDYHNISNVLKVSSTTICSVSVRYKYGNALRKIIQALIKKEVIEDFWLEIAETFASAGTVGTKGTGGWRYLKAEINKKRFNKPF